MSMDSGSHSSTQQAEYMRYRILREGHDGDGHPVDWSFYARLMKDHDDAMVRAWKEEIDTLLVFAGLFSAVVTAFNVEAYKLLQDDPSQQTVQILQTISQLLQQGGNSTLGSNSLPTRSPSRQSIRINALWFTSLVCALVSALIGIMVKQWLREYLAAVSLSSHNNIRLRQHRFDGLVAWNVPEIMAFLPILLELSLILFFAGLVDFLFSLQPVVAGVVTSVIGVSLLFYIFTTITPALSRRCPFKSPQSWAAICVCKVLTTWMHRLWSMFRPVENAGQSWTIRQPGQRHYKSWGERDTATVQIRLDDLDLEAMTWIHRTYIDHVDVQDSLASVIQELNPQNADTLVFGMIARKAHLSPATLMDQVRSRSCGHLLRDAGSNFDRRTKERVVRMLLKLLRIRGHPRDHEPSKIGRLEVLWALWEFSLGASKAERKIPSFVVWVLDGVADLMRRSEPFPLRRAALNLLCEGTLAMPHFYYPPDMGNIILFAEDCYRQNLRDLFVKACAVVLFPHGIVRRDEEYPRQQLQGLLRNLSAFLVQCNDEGIKCEPSSVGKLVSGLSALVEKEPDLVEPPLLDALLEGIQLGLLQLSQKEHLLLQGVLTSRALERRHDTAQQRTRILEPVPRMAPQGNE